LKGPIILATAAVVICAAIAGGVYLFWHKDSANTSSDQSQNTEQQQSQTPELETVAFDGTMKKLPDQKLYRSSSGPVSYYEAGTYTTGKYKDYKRIIAFYAPEETSYSFCCSDVFATSDMQSFVLSTASPSDLSLGTYSAKVSSTAELPTLFTPTVDLGDDNFVLVMQPNSLVSTLPKGAKALDGKNTQFKIYSDGPTVTDTQSTDGMSDAAINALKIEKQYLSTTNNVFLQDSTGLTAAYTIADKQHADAFVSADKKTNPIFSYDVFPIKATNLTSSASLYQTYGSLVPSICGTGNVYALNIADKDLKTVATMGSLQFYTLKDPGGALNQAQYYDKVTSLNEATLGGGESDMQEDTGDSATDSSDQVQTTPTGPTFQDYVAKTPIIMVKDPWGRWLGFGETQVSSSLSC
jgi:hypothetical protein